MTFGMDSQYSLYLYMLYTCIYMLYVCAGTCIASITNHCGHIRWFIHSVHVVACVYYLYISLA